MPEHRNLQSSMPMPNSAMQQPNIATGTGMGQSTLPRKSQGLAPPNQFGQLASSSYPSNPVLDFRYQSDFDENGVLFYLGTFGFNSPYQNPYSISQVKVFFSSMGKGNYEDFVGRTLVNCRT